MSDNAYKILLFTLLVVLSLTLGIFSLYAHTIMPGLKHVDSSTFVKSYQAIDTAIINPVFMLQFFLPIGLFIATFFYAKAHGLHEAKYILFGGLAYLIVILLTVVINVPLNDAVKKVDPSSSEQQLSQARIAFSEANWSISNLIRSLFNFVAIIFTAITIFIHK